MGLWQSLSNLRDYVVHNPPAATFFLCLLTLGFSFVCVALYSGSHTLPNPDTTKDWNHLLFSLSQFYLCVETNSSSYVDNSTVSPSLLRPETNPTAADNSTKSSSITLKNLRVPVEITTSASTSQLDDISLVTTISANSVQLGDKESGNLSVQIIPDKSKYACLTISAPARLLPMNIIPPKCPAIEKNISTVTVVVSKDVPTTSQTCYRLHSKNDPTFAVMLTKEEQSVAVRHLLEVGLCLLGVCLVLCFAASLVHSITHHQQWTNVINQNEPLLED